MLLELIKKKYIVIYMNHNINKKKIAKPNHYSKYDDKCSSNYHYSHRTEVLKNNSSVSNSNTIIYALGGLMFVLFLTSRNKK